MVIKFTKHDIIDSMSIFLPVLIAHLLLVVLSIVSDSLLSQSPLLLSLAVSATSFVYIALMVLSFRSYVYVIYTSIYQKNAVRNFTTPISSGQLLVSKLLTLMFWNLVILIETFILYYIASLLPANAMAMVYLEMSRGFVEGLQLMMKLPAGIMIQVILVAFGLTFLPLLVIIVSGAIAHSKWFSKLRGLWTFIISTGIFIVLTTMFVRFVLRTAEATMSGMLPLGGYDFMAWQLIGGIWLFIALFSVATIWLWNHKLEIMN